MCQSNCNPGLEGPLAAGSPHRQCAPAQMLLPQKLTAAPMGEQTHLEKQLSAKYACLFFFPCLLVSKPCRHQARALLLNYISCPNFCLSSYFYLLNFITCIHLFCLCELAHESWCECGGRETSSLPPTFRLLDLDLMTGTFICSVILPTPFFKYYFEEESH